MTQDNTLARSLHDLGLAAWFGGSLMGAVGVNGAAAQVQEPKQRLRVANRPAAQRPVTSRARVSKALT